MPRLVRRKPLMERVSAMLNPMDYLLWLSEELETRDWNSDVVGTQLGVAMNFLLLICRANTGGSAAGDDIFRDESGSGWLSFLMYPLLWILVSFSFSNAFYTLIRTRKYRLFEADVEVKPSTPSVRRVNVDSSPGSNSPLRYIADMITPESAASRAHPDKTKDVWELSVWDPLPISLRLFCLFSPGHVLVYLLFFPLASLDPRPSVTVFNALMMQIILSAQMLFLTTRFAQQAKDNAIVQKEVMHEYDTKFVHPRLHPIVRDVGTQFSSEDSGEPLVEVGTPATLIKRSFFTKPNPNYASHVTQDTEPATHSNVMRPQMFTPPTTSRRSDSFTPAFSQRASASRKSLPAGYTPFGATATTTSNTTGTNFGGHMGAYSHQKSPLKKTISMNDMNDHEAASPRNSREMAAYEQKRAVRQSSPTKAPNPWASMPSIRDLAPQNQGARQRGAPYERYPARF
ncbi:hypothetical protein NLU13_4760 [Sarocladium strictum]|uniref:Meiotically up-regulated gene 154 protein n=1 Tax=Sarocladium strictum TaxID=5046 RepID=A0AA39L8Y9_SARSR|nr:hypothetical protein NLU13_4760 [Sarocladium strictum]